MADPVGFEGANGIFYGPTEDIRDLQVFASADPPMIVSAWRLSRAELEQVNQTGVVWLTIYSTGMPPVSITSDPPLRVDGDKLPVAEPVMPVAPKRAEK